MTMFRSRLLRWIFNVGILIFSICEAMCLIYARMEHEIPAVLDTTRSLASMLGLVSLVLMSPSEAVLIVSCNCCRGSCAQLIVKRAFTRDNKNWCPDLNGNQVNNFRANKDMWNIIQKFHNLR